MSLDLNDRQLRRLNEAIDRLVFFGLAAVLGVTAMTTFVLGALAESGVLVGLGVALVGFGLLWFGLFAPDHVLDALPGGD